MERSSPAPEKEFGMSHQDRTDQIVVNHQTIQQVADELLPPGLFRSMKARKDATWKPRMLALGALLLVTAGKETLSKGFEQSRKILAKVFRWQLEPGSSYQGFVKQLRKWHTDLMLVIPPHFQTRMQETLPGQWEVAGYVVFAGDGSRVELSRTRSLETAFSPRKKPPRTKQKKQRSSAKTSNKGRSKAAIKKSSKQNSKTIPKAQSAESIAKKANSPQMWLTLLWHVGSGLPWDWRTGPSDSSERSHLEEMLPKLPENSLITADAGFVGYDFWSAILNAGHNFVVRVGGNVKLIKGLGYARQHEHTVYLWPDKAVRKNQPPLVLRLIEVNDGKQSMYLVTNLLKSDLSDEQAAKIYQARWGIELFFRTFKQTFGCRKLRSRAAENATWELDWSLIGLWCVCLLGEGELAADGNDPTRLSPAAAIAAFQDTVGDYRVRPERVEENLWQRLRVALLDDYERSSAKSSRNYPRKKQRDRISPPQITWATTQQTHAANQLIANTTQQRLPA
jgi:hypothetical protein